MVKYQETIETRGHLVDSHVLEQVFDTIVAQDGQFEVEEFRIGRTNTDESYLRMRVEAPSEATMAKLLVDLVSLGCGP